MKKGFTLAEVLITLSIIAVVSVMTIPSVLKSYRYKVYASSAKKVYAQIEDAVATIMIDEMAPNYIQTTAGVKNDCTVGAEKGQCYFLRHYFDVVNDCAVALNTKCLPEKYVTLSGVDAGPPFGSRCVQISNGASICSSFNIANNVTSFFFDVNGPAQPNIIGIDAYAANVDMNGDVFPWGTDEAECSVKSSDSKTLQAYVVGCLHKLMKNGWVIKD